MMDECEEKGISVDTDQLAAELGFPVVETVATTGLGMRELTEQLNSAGTCSINGHQPAEWVHQILDQVEWRQEPVAESTPPRTKALTALSLLGALVHLENYVGVLLGWPTLVGLMENFFNSIPLVAVPSLLVSALAVILGSLAPVLLPVLFAISTDSRFNERFGVWARHFVSGSFILLVTISLTYQLVGNLGAQVFVELLEAGLFETYITPLLQAIVPAGILHELLVGRYGLVSMGLAYGIAIVLPVVSTFFIAFSFLEDSGYLPRLSILSDRILRAMGLHGKAFLPMVLGLGCVTMATMTTRILSSKKERFIATLLLALGVPCSAQLGVVLGITAGFSFGALLLVFGTVFAQLVLVGFVLSRIYPGKRSPFILELPPIRCPVWRNILRKTFWRVRWFLQEALPLFLLGTLVLFLLDKFQLLGRIIAAAEPFMTRVLGLPKETAAVFLMGFLRRDYGAAGLFDMAREGLLDTGQIVIGLVVMTLFVPCIANFFVMIKEQGLRNSLLMVVFIVAYAFSVGAALNWALRALEVTL
jgi:ferrous iron transport protein B